jgi:disulfide bond formation protein DsbB
MTIVSFINIILSLGVIASQVFIIVAIIYFLFFRKKQHAAVTFLGQHGILLAFLVSLAATLSSLFYSQIAGFAPCDLCWFQRIFMYPEVILLGIALVKKDSKIIDYAVSLSVVGFLVSLYHNYIYYYNGGLNVFCQLGGTQVSCIKRYVFEFGYITIPLMALTGFALILIFLMFAKQHKK